MLVQKEFNFEKADAYLERCIQEAIQDATVCTEENVEEARSLVFILMKIRNGLRNFDHNQNRLIILKTNGSREGDSGEEYDILQVIGFVEECDIAEEKGFLCDCYDPNVEYPQYHYYVYEAGVEAGGAVSKEEFEFANRCGVSFLEIDIFDNLNGEYNALLDAEFEYICELGGLYNDTEDE